MKQIQIAPNDIILRTFEEDFLKAAPSEDIALIRYEHYLIKRNSKKYNICSNLISEKLAKLRDTMNMANSYGAIENNKPTPQSR